MISSKPAGDLTRSWLIDQISEAENSKSSEERSEDDKFSSVRAPRARASLSHGHGITNTTDDY